MSGFVVLSEFHFLKSTKKAFKKNSKGFLFIRSGYINSTEEGYRNLKANQGLNLGLSHPGNK